MPKTTAARTKQTVRYDPLKERNANAPKPGQSKFNSTTKATTDKDSQATPLDESEHQSGEASAQANTSQQTLPSSKSNYLVLVRLDASEDPTVTRLLSLSPDMTFAQVHEALQVAFNWTDSHAHSFDVWTSDFQGMTMNGLPCGPDGCKLKILTDVEFDMFRADDEPMVKENDITLGQVYEDPRFQGKAVIGYEYDHGDSWVHIFSLIGRTTADVNSQMTAPEGLSVYCLGGEGHHVAEDCGSGPGWEDLKAALKKGKRGDPEGLKGWYERDCLNGGKEKFDPYHWDWHAVNRKMVKAFPPTVS